MTTKKSCVAGGISAGILGAFAFLLMYIVVVPWVSNIYAADGTMNGTPVLSITREWLGMPWLGIIYYLLMILALVSSGAPSLYIAATRIRSLIPVARKSEKQMTWLVISAVLFCVVVIFLAATGLNAIVSKYFQYLGYFGQIFGVIPMVVIWPILRAKGGKPVIPGLEKAGTDEA